MLAHDRARLRDRGGGQKGRDRKIAASELPVPSSDLEEKDEIIEFLSIDMSEEKSKEKEARTVDGIVFDTLEEAEVPIIRMYLGDKKELEENNLKSKLIHHQITLLRIL